MTREKAIIILTNTASLLHDGTRYMKPEHEKQFREAYEMAIKALEQPEIIRCEDCKYQNKGENESESWNYCGYRPWSYVTVTDNHYCGYAKRRTVKRMRTIDADALINRLVFHTNLTIDFKEIVEDVINEMPTIQPEQLQDNCEGCCYKDRMSYQCESCARYFPDRYMPEEEGE